MRFQLSAHISAPTSIVWLVLSDVGRWPSLTDSIERVRVDSTCRFGLESSARVKQPGIPELTWTVTRWDPGNGFDWQARSPGVTTVGTHLIERDGSGSRLTLGIEQTGWLAPPIALLSGKRTRQYVQLELEGLTRAAEAMRRAA